MDKSTVGGEREMGTEWVKVERIGSEEEGTKIKLDSSTRQSVVFTKLRLVMAQVHILSAQWLLRSQQPGITLLQLPHLWHGDWDSFSRRIIEGPELH